MRQPAYLRLPAPHMAMQPLRNTVLIRAMAHVDEQITFTKVREPHRARPFRSLVRSQFGLERLLNLPHP